MPAVIIKNPSNINYLTGFSGSNACLLITFQKKYFFTDSRYLEDSKKQFKSWIVQRYSKDFHEIVDKLYDLSIVKVGYDKNINSI